MSEVYFVSKKDALYFWVIWGTIAFIFISIMIPFLFTLSFFNFIWGFLGLIFIGLFLWLWFGTGYHVENNKVKIQHGPFKQIVNIQEIKKISKQKSVWSAAALAMDRLVIKHGQYNWDVIVSPENEYEFVKLLLNENAQIEIDEKLSELYQL